MYTVTAWLIRPNTVLFRQSWHDCIGPPQDRNKIVCRAGEAHSQDLPGTTYMRGPASVFIGGNGRTMATPPPGEVLNYSDTPLTKN